MLLEYLPCIFLLFFEPFLSPTPTKTIYYSDQDFGWSISSAGDVNNDGYDEIIVRSGGNAYVFLGSASGPSNSVHWTIAVDYLYGQNPAVAAAGDVNGDGYDDILVGGSKRAFAYYGSATGLAATASWTAQFNSGDIDDIFFGNQVAPAGDINKDGYDDILLGALDTTYVYQGSASGLATGPSWQVPLGFPFSYAGDVNGDGYSDVIVRSNLYYGSAVGLAVAASWTTPAGITPIRLSNAGDVNSDGYDDILLSVANGVYAFYGSASGPGGSANWSATGGSNSSYFGSAIASAGDINKDGFDDIIVGDYLFYNSVVTSYGNAFVYYGSLSGINNQPQWKAQGGRTCLCGITSNFAWAVASAGDVNGDGFGDLMISEPHFYYNLSGPRTGAVYIYHGDNIIGAPIFLPLRFLSFNASRRGANVQLEWSVTDQTLNKSFDVERSLDGVEFRKIAEVPAAAAVNEYEYLDRLPSPTVNYYRIRQINLDGSYTYSVVCKVELNELNALQIFPNPASKSLWIRFPEQGQFRVHLYSSTGQLVKSLMNNGQTVLSVGVVELPAGTYAVRIEEGSRVRWTNMFLKE